MKLRCGMRCVRAAQRSTLGILTTTLLVAAALSAPGSRALATDSDRLQIETELVAEVRVETSFQGRPLTRFIPATAIVQGQTVYYTVRVHNPTPVPARDVITVQKIPVNTTYVIGSAAGPAAEISFSIDGGQSFFAESDLKIAEPSGVDRRALATEYTHIRWRLRNALAPGATALARFQAVFR